MNLAPFAVALAVTFGLTSGAALAERARGSYVHANPELVDTTRHNSNVIFLNGCFGTGCDFTPGNENSTTNTSSLLDSTRHMPPFSGGQVQWDAIVECVRDTYKPFNIEITDVDPGDAPHFEAVVAGLADDIGQVGLIGGIAPFMCGETINNGISFTFAELVDNEVDETCWVVAQETAHVFGLDHEYLCSDPMSYLRSCDYNKRFQDEDAPCGEFSERECACNGPTQNSYQTLLAHFGEGIPTPPTLSIVSPADGDEVQAGFTVRAEASDDIRVDRVEVRINSVAIGSSQTAPYIFNAPAETSDGRLRIEVSAFDNYDYRTTKVIEVLQGEPCSAASDCAGLETCVSGRCVPGPDAEDGLGHSCSGPQSCASSICTIHKSERACTEVCTGDDTCPPGFGCLGTAEGSVCWPGHDEGGCSVGKGRGDGVFALFLILCGIATRRRRLLG
mgnify:CR=1 FL=1|tara:strand:+ start:113129 stop:114469 length:1341 start_codon:yes stop_codon:yes gene_type:complete